MVFHNTAQKVNGVLVSREMGISQRNLAVLIVDQMQSPASHLEGIWLLISAADTPQLILVPVFPEQVAWAAPLKDKFDLTEKLHPNTEFLDHLSDLLLWDHYLLIDQHGINSIMAAAGRDNTDALAASQLTFDEQNSFWGLICAELATIKQAGELESYFKRFSQYGRTDIPWSEMTLFSWKDSGAGEKFTCEFPTLELVSH